MVRRKSREVETPVEPKGLSLSNIFAGLRKRQAETEAEKQATIDDLWAKYVRLLVMVAQGEASESTPAELHAVMQELEVSEQDCERDSEIVEQALGFTQARADLDAATEAWEAAQAETDRIETQYKVDIEVAKRQAFRAKRRYQAASEAHGQLHGLRIKRPELFCPVVDTTPPPKLKLNGVAAK